MTSISFWALTGSSYAPTPRYVLSIHRALASYTLLSKYVLFSGYHMFKLRFTHSLANGPGVTTLLGCSRLGQSSLISSTAVLLTPSLLGAILGS